MRNVYLSLSLVCWMMNSQQFLAAQVYPPDFAHVQVGGGLRVPTAIAFAPDGRIFVTEQTGNVRVIKNNATMPTPFTSIAVDSRGERGLLGIAIDPDFLTNHYVYVYYTVPATPAFNRISRFTASNDVAVPGSETVILNLGPLSTATIHNGGALHFGNDGKLYVAVGENANPDAAQNLDSYHGKLLRINKDGSVPADNPFPTGSEQRRRVWAYGLRNPFTFAIERETGKIFVNDVGQSLWEEVNDATQGGRNFGWPMTEGKFNAASYPNLTNPVYAYGHGTVDGVGCAIVGGGFVSASNVNYPPQYRGKYFFQDNCGNWINYVDVSGTRFPFATSVILNSLGLTTGIDGHLYYIARHYEGVFKIIYNKTTIPVITSHPKDASVAQGQPVSFAVSALGTEPITYQWQKNGSNISGATNPIFNIAQTTTADAGQYRVVISNAAGSITSNPATLAVISNAVPVAEILTPVTGATYTAGTTIQFSGRGTDAEDGTLPDQAFSWAIHFHHDTHKHDQPPVSGIPSGSFDIPREGETSDNVWYRIILTVTDANGLKGKDSVDIVPLKSTLTFETDPPGLKITLDGQPFDTPGSVVSVEGLLRTINVPSPQTINNQTYEFESWSHAGNQLQQIQTPQQDVVYTANFRLSENQSSFYRAININGVGLTIDGNPWESGDTAPNFSLNGIRFSNNSVVLNPATDANRTTMIRSAIWGDPSVSVAGIAAGQYYVWLYVWEDNFPVTFSVAIENNIVETNYNSGGAGTWKKLGPYPVIVTDGTLNVNAIGLEANFSGIEIWTSGQQNRPPVIAKPIADQNALVGASFNFTFDANTFSDPDSQNSLAYTATLQNGTSLPGWLSFNSVTRNFSGIPAVADEGELTIQVRATDNAGAFVTDEFKLNVTAAETFTFYRAININGPSLLIDGNNWEASATAPNFSFNGAPFSNQSIALSPATDNNRATMIRSAIWWHPEVFINAVPTGDYQIWVYVWEDNFPVSFSLYIEDGAVAVNYSAGSAGRWQKLGPFPVALSDGTINIHAVGLEANISGIEIWSSAAQSSSQTARLLLQNEKPPAEIAQLTAYPNPFSEDVKVKYFSSEANTSIVLYDARGRKVHTLADGQSSDAKEILLRSEGLTNGVYFLEMRSGEHYKRLKLVLAR